MGIAFAITVHETRDYGKSKMQSIDQDPAHDEQLRELASIFAVGVIRLRGIGKLIADSTPPLETLAGFAHQGLDGLATTVLTVHSG